ncbi:MAG: response regulator [Desulfotomaculaceae bacterium]
MIKAVLIDDERPALRVLAHLLKENMLIEISGMFTNPLEAMDQIAGIKPQIVFLDINMPQLQGIDAASKILDLCPDTDIIFVTAYDQYAIEAFELHALDYVLKPVSRERFEKTLQRVIKKNNLNRPCPVKKLEIKCFGQFQMGWLGEEPVKWRTEKTRELFAFLLHHQGRAVAKDEIIDQLWPEAEVEKAVHQLHNGIYYIRKTLEKYGIERSLISIHGSYSMKLGVVDLDVLLFRACFIRIKNNPATEDLKALDELYTGEYMEGADWRWAEIERERLSRQYGQVVVGLSQAYIEKKEFNRAGELLLKAFNRNPYEESVTELLLKLYRMTGDKAKAARHFMEYARILKQELGIKPQENIQKIYASIK